jgi:hypothetical protein
VEHSHVQTPSAAKSREKFPKVQTSKGDQASAAKSREKFPKVQTSKGDQDGGLFKLTSTEPPALSAYPRRPAQSIPEAACSDFDPVGSHGRQFILAQLPARTFFNDINQFIEGRRACPFF